MVGKGLMAMVGLGKEKDTGQGKGKGRALEEQPRDSRDLSAAFVAESSATEPFKRQRREKYGLFELNPDDQTDTPGERYAVDFVSVHGITGDAYSTWTAANGVFWLQDFLPKQFPGAKVYSFGYPADVFYSKSAAGLDMHARGLLELMKAYGLGMVSQSFLYEVAIFLSHMSQVYAEQWTNNWSTRQRFWCPPTSWTNILHKSRIEGSYFCATAWEVSSLKR